MQPFSPATSLAGGLLIGLAASLLLIASGRTAGISGIVGGLLAERAGDRAWRALFLMGLLAAGLFSAILAPTSLAPSPRTLAWVAVAGVSVGIGTRLGNGCTSGHGICGISRLSPRSALATLSFMGSGMVTVAVVRWLGAQP